MPIDITVPEQEFATELNETYQFCTECLIIGDNIDQNSLREQLDTLGNCLIVAGSTKKTKVHIHVNDPTQLFDICGQYGILKGEKADDMIHQQKSINHRQSTVAILTDSGADFPEGMIANLDIHVVPIVINFGNKSYLDKVSMNATEFYQELKHNRHHPKTSQPSFGDFQRQYQYLSSHYESIIAVHIPANASGTYNASKTAAEKCNHDNEISVLNSRNFSVGQGLIVRYIAEAAKAGMNKQQLLTTAQTIINNTHTFAALTNLNFAVRGGRISAKLKIIADLLHLTPVISINNNGKIATRWLLWGRKHIAKKLLQKIKKTYSPNKTYRIVIMHTNCKSLAIELRNLVKKTYPNLDSLDIVDCGAALAAHAGPGAIGMSLQEYYLPRNEQEP